MYKNALIIFGATVLVLVLFLPAYSRMQDLRARNHQYEMEIEALKKLNVILTEEKRMLEEDPEYLEKVAREKMGLIKEGEVVYRMMQEEKSQ